MKKKTKREHKPSPEAAALLLIADHLRVIKMDYTDNMVALRRHEARQIDQLNDIASGVQIMIAEHRSQQYWLRSCVEQIASAIHGAARELKPAPSWWRRQWSRLQLWWWNRKITAPVIEHRNLVDNAVQDHLNRIENAPKCGRWS